MKGLNRDMCIVAYKNTLSISILYDITVIKMYLSYDALELIIRGKAWLIPCINTLLHLTNPSYFKKSIHKKYEQVDATPCSKKTRVTLFYITVTIILSRTYCYFNNQPCLLMNSFSKSIRCCIQWNRLSFQISVTKDLKLRQTAKCGKAESPFAHFGHQNEDEAYNLFEFVVTTL